MRKRITVLAVVVMALSGACGSETSREGDPQGEGDAVCRTGGALGSLTEIIDYDIARDTCLSNDTVYVLNPKADGSYVKVKAGATLTIQPGTTVKGNPGSALVVTRGGQIIADGTQLQPIVFTSNRPVGMRRGGDWGGLLLLGRAPTNWAGNNQLFEALPATETDGRYGGDDPEDDSGVLRHVRIEFAGFEYQPNKEFNGLTLGGVGRGTTIDFVQVHRGSDDGVELFGGTVDLRHLLLTLNEDDGLDTDNGWTGRAQFVVVHHTNGTSSDPNGYESDNHPTDYGALPRTSPTIFNATIIGDRGQSKPSFGAVLRRGTAGLYANHIFTDFSSAALEVRDAATAAQVPLQLNIQHSIFANNAADGSNWSDAQTDLDERAAFAGAPGNVALADVGLDGVTDEAAPSYLPTSSASALSGGATPPADGFFDPTATYIGALGQVDWTQGWCGFPVE